MQTKTNASSTSPSKRIDELVGKLIIMKEFCDYMTVVNFLKGSAYCQVFYDVYFECSRLIEKHGRISQ